MKRIRILGLLCVLALGTTACAQVEPPIIVDMEDVAASIFGDKEEASVAEEEEASGEASEVANGTEQAQEDKRGSAFQYKALEGLKFVYGASAWRTEMKIDKSGKFSGIYQDYDASKQGDGYEGAIYYSQFSGEFTKPEKINSTTYRFQIKAVEYPLGQNKRVVDRVLYVYNKAPGIDGSKEFYLYLPGTKVADLPQEYKNSVDAALLKEETINFYGLYHKGEGEGFYSFEVDSDYAMAESILREADATVTSLKAELANAKTQQEVNMLTYEMYQEWDVALNHVWSILEDTLDEKTYAKVLKEEQKWIEKKRAMKKSVKAKFDGVYMAPFIMYSEAAEMTEERAYELLEYLK